MPFELGAGAALLLVSMIINGLGAISQDTWRWNTRPVNVDDHPERNWDWRQPQFLAGFVNPPLPDRIGVAGPNRIDFATPASAAYLWYGWSPAERASRWTEGNEATLVFRVDAVHELLFTMKLHAFVIPNHHPQQRVSVKLNGSVIENLWFKDSEPHEVSFTLPANMLLTAKHDAVFAAGCGIAEIFEAW